MIPRSDGREGMVARVNEAECTSCGICIASCPPMAIGPAGVTGRDQVADVRAYLAEHQPTSRDVVIVGCGWSAAAAEAERCGARYMQVSCVGAMHSSTVELLLRGGAGGVLVVGCPEHDGRTREGMTWARERLFEGRRADLKERVDRDRVRLVEASLGEHVLLHAAARAFADEIGALADADSPPVNIVDLCRGLHVTAGDVGPDGT
jgi:coenzyme F420-reducing hydrogenase delta subunit